MTVTTYRGNHPDPRGRLATARLYLCTDARRDTGDLARFIDEALTGGVDIVQLRDKGSAGEKKYGRLEARDELAALSILADACARHGALLAVNDRADIALAAGADILHLGQGDTDRVGRLLLLRRRGERGDELLDEHLVKSHRRLAIDPLLEPA